MEKPLSLMDLHKRARGAQSGNIIMLFQQAWPVTPQKRLPTVAVYTYP